MSRTVGEIQLQMAADIARLRKSMDEAERTVGRSMGRITNSVDSARRAFLALAAVSIGGGLRLQIQELAGALDSFNKFETQLKLATKSQQEFNQALSESKRIASVAQADLESVGTLYARVNNALQDYGASTTQISAITEGFALALKTSGATAQESRSAIIQFSQAMAAGALRSEEFNSVAEASPKFMRLLADSLGVPVGALKKLGSEGKLTTDVLANALIPNLENLRKEAAQIQTISGAFTRFTNSLKETLGALDKQFGITKKVADGLKFIADNGRELTIVLTGIVATGITVWLAGMAANAIKATTALIATANAARLLAKAEVEAAVASATASVQSARASAALTAGMRAKADTQIRAATEVAKAEAALTAAMAAQTRTVGLAAAGLTGFKAVVAALGGGLSALITVIGLAATAFLAFGSNAGAAATVTDKLREKQKALNDEMTRGNKILAEGREREIVQERLQLLREIEASKRIVTSADTQLKFGIGDDDDLAQASSARRAAIEDLKLQLMGLAEIDKRLAEQKQAVNQLEAPSSLALSQFIGGAADDLKRASTNAEKLNSELDGINTRYERLKELVAAVMRERGADQATIDRSIVAIEKRRVVEVNAAVASTKGAKEAARGQQNLLNFYEDVSQAIAKRLVDLKEESESANGLTEGDKLASRVKVLLAENYKQLTAAQRASIEMGLREVLRQEEANAQYKEAVARLQAYTDAFLEVRNATLEATLTSSEYQTLQLRQKGLSEEVARAFVAEKQAVEGVAQSYATLRDAQADAAALRAQNKERERQIAVIFGNAQALAELRAAELDATAAILERNAAYVETNALGLENEAALREQAEAIRDTAEAYREQARETRRGGALDRQLQIAQDIKEAFSQVGQAFANSLFDGARKGKSIMQDLLDFIKNSFKNIVIRVLVNPIINGIGGAVFGAFGLGGPQGSGTLATGGSGGGSFSLLGAVQNIGSSLSGGIISSLGNLSSIFGRIGFSSGQSFLAGVSNSLQGGVGTFASTGAGSSAFSAGQFFGKAAPFLPAVFSLLQGDFKGAAFSGGGAAIGSLFGPGGALIGSTLGSLLGGLFGGSGPKAISTQAVTTRQGSAAGRDGKAGSIEGILDGIGSINAQFITRLDGLLQAAGVARAADLSVASEIGLFDKRRRGGFNFQISAGGRELVSGANDTFGNDVKVIAEALTKDLFGPALRDAFIALAEDVVSPAIRDFLSAVETPEEIEQRIGVITQLQGASELLNDKFGTTVDQMVQLANEGGNIAAVLEGLNGLISPIEGLELQAQRLQERFVELGVSAPVNAEALRRMIQQIDKSTAAGRELAAGLAQLAPAFQQVEAARQQALDAADQQIGSIFGAIVAERDAALAALQSLVDEQVRAIEDTTSAFDDIIASLRDFRQELEFIAGDTGPFALSIRRAQFEGVARRAALGDIEAAQSLPDVGRGLLEVAAEQSATREDFLRELARVRNGVDAAEATAVRQKSIQEQQLDVLREQVDGLIDLNATQLTIEQAVANLETAEAAVQTASRQLEALGLINTSVLSLDDRLRELAEALGVAITERQRIAATGGVTQAVQTQVAAVQAANSVVNGLAATIVTDRERQIAGVYQSLLGRSADIGGLGSFAASSLTIAQIEDAVRGSEEFRVRQGGAAAQNEFNRLVNAALGSSTNIQAFANGGTFGGGLRLVGERGPELEVTGPSRIFSANQTRDILGGGGDMAAEMRALRQEVSLLRAEARATAVATTKSADLLFRATDGGQDFIRTEAAA